MGASVEDTANGRKQKLSTYLKVAILTLKFGPGSDLDEAHLSEELGLSRTPLREVFRELAGEGYIDLRQNRGARVSEMSHTTLRDFFLAAPMIYSAVMRLAAQHALPEQIAALKTAQIEFKAALDSGISSDRALANNRFHQITGEMAHNIYLLPSFKRLLIDHARIGMTFYRPQNYEMAANLTTASQQHDAIIKAIEVGDADACAKLAIDHWNLSRDQIEMFVMPTSLDVPLDIASQRTSA